MRSQRSNQVYITPCPPRISIYVKISILILFVAVGLVGGQYSYSAAQTAPAAPQNFLATRGLDAGEIDLSWDEQVTFVGPAYSSAKYQYRAKLTTANWPSGGGWTDIPGSNHRTVSHTVEGLRAGQLYDVAIRFLATSSLISPATAVTVTPTAVSVPQSVAAGGSETTVGAILVSWTAQTDTTNSEAKFQVRYKLTTASWPATTPYGWMDVSDGSDSGSHTHDEYETTITGLTPGQRYDIELRFHHSDAVGTSNAVAVEQVTASGVAAPLVDYDIDDDNLIEVRTAAQFQAIHHDLDGDGSPATLGAISGIGTWSAAFPNAMPNAGCPLRDHDSNTATPNARSCLGYELIADIDFNGATFVPLGKQSLLGATDFTGQLVGNGFRVMNPARGSSTWPYDDGYDWGVVSKIGDGGSVEGLGVVNPGFYVNHERVGGITGELKGTIIGSYVQDGTLRVENSDAGGIAGQLTTGTGFAGKILHSYARGVDVGNRGEVGGLIGDWKANTGTNAGLCLNSYFSGQVDSNGNHGLIAGTKSGGTVTNCVADTSTDDDNEPAWNGASNTENTTYRATNANMVAVTDYGTPSTNNPFANWDDYAHDGTALSSNHPRTDFWDFGDGSTLPVLKAFGHDYTAERARPKSGTQTVNLCARTLAVANEIIRLLKDSDVAPGVSTTIPADVTSLTDCSASSDTRNVSITNLTNLVVTTESNPLNLSPDRTDPASAKLTYLDTNDFAYLTNATHFDLSGNSFTTLPSRLFQGVPLRWLDLSDNELVSLPADLFAGMATVAATTGNMLFLNGNALTYTGIADRVFDPLSYLNGLDLSDNALTQINTRWFEKLANLGHRPATGAEFRDKLGLHLSGNTITMHYYSNKLFTGIRENIVYYSGTTTGDTLRTLIKAAITEAAGGTTPTTLDIDSTDHFRNRDPPAYLGVNDTCPSGAERGPAGHADYFYEPPECYVVPKWSPPYVRGAITTAPAALVTESYPTQLFVTTSYNRGADYIALQVRSRVTPTNLSDPWTQIWKTVLDTGDYPGGVGSVGTGVFWESYVHFPRPVTGPVTTVLGLGPLTSGTSYQVQVRALSSSAPPSVAVTATATTLTSPAAPTGLSASSSTTAAGAIDLDWTQLRFGVNDQNYAQDKYQYRIKLSTASDYGAWTDIAGSDQYTYLHTLTGLRSGSRYDVQVRYHWSDVIGASAASQTATATASGVQSPTDFEANPGTDPGTIDLSWDAVPGASGYEFRCNPAGTGCTTTWTNAGNGTTHTVTGLTGGRSYSLDLRAITSTSQSSSATATSRAQNQPGPGHVAATQGTDAGQIDLTWTYPTAGTVTRYEYRFKLASNAFYPSSGTGAWTQVLDGSDSGTLQADETAVTITSLLGGISYNLQLRVLTAAGHSLPSTVTSVAKPVAAPSAVTAIPGTNPGTIDLAWTTIPSSRMPTGDTVVNYQFRTKLSSAGASTYTAWTNITGGWRTSTYTVTGLSAGDLYDVEIRAAIDDGGDRDSAADYYSSAASNTSIRAGLAAPQAFVATGGLDAGEIDLTWTEQTDFVGPAYSSAKYQYRAKRTTANWPSGGGWTDIPGSNYRTASHTVEGFRAGQGHDVELRFLATNWLVSPATAVRATPTAVPVPQNVAAWGSETTVGAILVSWDQQTDTTNSEAKFQIRHKLTTASWPATTPYGWTDVADGSDSGSHTFDEGETTITGLASSQRYDIELRFYWSDAVGVSNAVAVERVTASGVPGPTGFDATTGSGAGEIDLSWNAVPGATGYQYRCRPAQSRCTTTWTTAGTGTSHTITNLNGGAYYNIQLRALVTGSGQSAPTAAERAQAQTTPGPAAISFAHGPNPGDIKIDWTPPANLAPVTHYEYRYKLETASVSAYSAWTTVADSGDAGTSPANEVTVTISNLQAGISYDVQFRVLASTAIGYSLPQRSTQTARPIPPPTSFTATAGIDPGDVDLSWTASAGVTVLRYELRHRQGANFAWSNWTSAGTATSHTYAVLPTGVPSTFQLRAVMQTVGASAPVATTATPTPVAAPCCFIARRGTNPGTIDLTWVSISAAGLPIGDSVVNYQFRTKLSSPGTSAYTAWTNITGGASTVSYTVTGLSAGDLYDIEIRAAIDSGGDQDSTADYHSSAALSTFARAGLAIPANLSATSGLDAGRVDLSWTAQTTFGPAYSSAKYQYRAKLTSANWPSAGGWTDIPRSDYMTSSYTINGLAAGQLHDIELRFLATSALISAASETVRATPRDVPVPRNVSASASATTVGAIHLAWTQQVDTTSSEAKYQVRYKRTSTSWPTMMPYGWMDVADGPDSGSHTHDEYELTIAGLNLSQRYDVELRFHWSDAVGVSNAANVAASASRVPTPTGFEATTGSEPGEIDLSWNPVTGATSYLYWCFGCSTLINSAGTGTSHTITGLAGAGYSFALQAILTDNVLSPPTPQQPAYAQTTPGPAILTFSQGPSPGEIRIDWVPPANNAPVEHYEYRYKRESAQLSEYSGWQTVADSDDAGTSQADEVTTIITGLLAGVSYHVQFRLNASSSIGYSLPQRGTQTAKPVAPPMDIKCRNTLNPGEVIVSWTAPRSTPIVRYELRHRQVTTGEWSNWISAGASAAMRINPDYTFTGLRAGVRYAFQVRVVSYPEVNVSVPSRSVSCNPAPVPTPTSFTASTGTFPGEVDLSWKPVTGATSYVYRYSIDSPVGSLLPAIGTWQDESTTTSTSATITLLREGRTHTIELWAVVAGVGVSDPISSTARAGSAHFTDSPTTPIVSESYSVSITKVPGRIAIKVPQVAEPDPFIYRHRTANPGEWSRWFKVTLDARESQYLIPDLDAGVRYEVQVRAYTGPTTGFTTALSQEAEAAPFEVPSDLKIRETSGVIRISWSSPETYTPDSYEYRSRPAGAATWGDWVTVPHEGDLGATQKHYITDLESGVTYQFELRIVTAAGRSPVATAGATSRVRLPEINGIRPDVREVTLRAGDTIRLGVDVYNQQDTLDNGIAGKATSLLVFRWTEVDAGGGNFGSPDNGRQVVYTAPSSPGTYTVQAEAQPDGICSSHHAEASAISAANRAPCIATFTIRVTRAAGDSDLQPDPINPAGVIPTSLTDNTGFPYTVFTPAEGGTFTGEGFTVSAPAGAVPDRTVVGISAARSGIPVPMPVPGASMTVAGRFYDINAISQDNAAPLTSYSLEAPLSVCLPFPTEFRADLSDVVVVTRSPHDGALTILTTKIRTNAGDLSACGAITTLPATVGVAKLGAVATIPPTPMPDIDTPDTGATAPGFALLLLTLLAGVLLLTGMSRICRIIA